MTSVATRAKALGNSNKVASAGAVRNTRRPMREYAGTAKDLFAFSVGSLVGRKVAVTLREGEIYEGVLHSWFGGLKGQDGPEASTVYLHWPVFVNAQWDHLVHVPKARGDFLMKDIVSIEARDVDLFSEQIDAAAVGNLGSVRADTDIEIDRSRLGQERELVAATAWLGGGEGGVGGIDGGGGAGHEKYRPGWDQFSVNERLTGVRSDYSEELYTTKLELGSYSREQRQRAARLAREIETKATDNVHVAEERGQRPVGEDMDEVGHFRDTSETFPRHFLDATLPRRLLDTLPDTSQTLPRRFLDTLPRHHRPADLDAC